MTPEIEQQIDLAHRARESGDLETAGLLYRQLLIHPETRAVAAEARALAGLRERSPLAAQAAPAVACPSGGSTPPCWAQPSR